MIIFGKQQFKLHFTTIGDFLELRKSKDPNVGRLITYKTVDPTPKGQRLNYKDYNEMQQIMLYPLLGIDMPKFMINKLKESIKVYNNSSRSIEQMFFEQRDGGGRVSTFVSALLGNHVTFPKLEDIVNADMREALRKMEDENGQLVYKHLQGKSIVEIKYSMPDLYNMYMEYPLTFTVYEYEAPYGIAFNFTNTIKVPSAYTLLASSEQPIVQYLLDKSMPDFRKGTDAVHNKSLLPLFFHTWKLNEKTGVQSVKYDYLNLDGENNNGFEHALKMYFNCTNTVLGTKEIKSVREFKPLNQGDIIAYANDEHNLDFIIKIFEETCGQVYELIKEIQTINKKKKASSQFPISAVMVRILHLMILELRNKFKGKFSINYKNLANAVYNAYINISTDSTPISQSQVLNRTDIIEFRSRNSAFTNYKGKEATAAFAWCVEQLLIEMLDSTKKDYGLSNAGINVKDKRGYLTKAQQLEIMKKSRNADGKLVSAVTGMAYDDESKLEFAHLYAIGLGKYIFTKAVDEIHNIVLVERVLNRTMGQMSVYAFKEEYDKNPEPWLDLLKTD